MKALYRKYRPLKLSDVVGQEQVVKPLESALSAGKVGHAYIFAGPRGTGKTSVARILAHEINGFTYNLEDDYVDIVEMDGASNRGIDDVRELREKVAIAPTAGKYKVYIIDEVHMFTKEAFNALLKTLEEPPQHVVFIMATTDLQKVPATILSRAQKYEFRLAEPEAMLKHLKMICENEKINITDDALKIIVKRGGGSYRDTLSLLEQIATLSEAEINKDLVTSAIGLAAEEKTAALLNDYASGDLQVIAADLKALYATGASPKAVAEGLMEAIMEDPRPEYLGLLVRLPEVKTPYPEARLLVALATNAGVVATPSSGGARGRISTQRPASQTRPESSSAATNTAEPLHDNVVQNSPTVPEVSPKDRKAMYDNVLQENQAAQSFDWDQYLEKIRSMNDAIYMQLRSVEFTVSGDTLHIYPTKKVAKMILSRDNNKHILVEAAGGMKVLIHDLDENPNIKKDPLISKISDIMGGEVKNDTGGNPFE